MELTALDAGDYYSSYGDDDGAGGNSTCAQWTTCSPCLDFFDDDGSGCLWCNVPKGGGAEGLCLPRLRAQDRCEIGELQVKHSDLAFRASNHFYVSYLVFSIVGFSAAVSLLHQHSTRTAVPGRFVRIPRGMLHSADEYLTHGRSHYCCTMRRAALSKWQRLCAHGRSFPGARRWL